MQESVFTDTIVRYSNHKIRRLLLLSATVIILMTLYIIYGIPLGDGFYRSWTLNVLAPIAIILLTVTGILFLRRMADHRPGLIAGAEGLIDYSGLLPGAEILWADITGIDVVKVHQTRMIRVGIKDPEGAIRAQKNVLYRWSMKLNYQRYGSPLMISSSTLDISFDNLYALLAGHLLRHHEGR